MEDYEKKYKEALEKANSALKDGGISSNTIAYIQSVFPELKESEDERIRNALIRFHKSTIDVDGIKGEDVIAWLEKQGEQKPTLEDAAKAFLEALSETPYNNTPIVEAQIITKQLLIFLSAPKSYNPDAINEQKPADKVYPKFKVGDWVVHDMSDGRKVIRQIINMTNKSYVLNGEDFNTFYFNDLENDYHLWTIQDAKDGDVLTTSAGAFIYNGNNGGGSCPGSYCGINTLGRFRTGVETHWTGKPVFPATKEQRDALERAMTNAGYTFDFEKKELKKIDNEEVNGEDYGIDSLYHAQRILEKTLGSVDGYQSDDGILEHKCAITAVKKLYKQKPAWSEEDEVMLNSFLHKVEVCDLLTNKENVWIVKKLKSLRPQPNIENTRPMLSDFFNAEYERGKADALKCVGWSEEDETGLVNAIIMLKEGASLHFVKDDITKVVDWLKSLKQRIGG